MAGEIKVIVGGEKWMRNSKPECSSEINFNHAFFEGLMH
jgi:hypothetical protein